jgi:signal transduction histidine kinase
LLRQITGLRVALVARVDDVSWTACAIVDGMGLGIQPGDHLDVSTTFCNVVRTTAEPLLVTQASVDARFVTHPAWRMYGVESYIAVPLNRRNGEPFGVLCALDPDPAPLDEQQLKQFKLLASLIAFELEADEQEQHRTEQVDRERAAFAVRDEFLASVAHDLKNPLTSIQGFAALAQRLTDRGEAMPLDRLRVSLRNIERSAVRMSASIDELVDLAHLRMNKSLELQPAPIDLMALVREVATEYQQASAAHPITVSGPESVVGTGDQARLTRVIQNLLGNAIRYSPKGGAITVAVERQVRGDAAWAVIRVTDQGLGVPAADLPRIFDQFHRGANVERQFSGTGIGLFSVRQIVEQHGGTVTVESTEGCGSTFTVVLPL